MRHASPEALRRRQQARIRAVALEVTALLLTLLWAAEPLQEWGSLIATVSAWIVVGCVIELARAVGFA